MSKIFWFYFIAAHIFLFSVVLFLITRKEEPSQKEQCVSLRALNGCEQAAADVEEQLRTCEHAFIYCAQVNAELKDRLEKGEEE